MFVFSACIALLINIFRFKDARCCRCHKRSFGLSSSWSLLFQVDKVSTLLLSTPLHSNICANLFRLPRGPKGTSVHVHAFVTTKATCEGPFRPPSTSKFQQSYFLRSQQNKVLKQLIPYSNSV